MRKIFVIFILSVVFCSCARTIYVDYQVDSQNTGTIKLIPSKGTEKATVTMNDNLIVSRKRIKKLIINNVPEGSYNLNFVSESSYYKDPLNENLEIEIKDKKDVTKLISVPPYNAGYYIVNSIPLAIAFASLYISILY
jgi:hypothetical protein